MKEQAFQLFLSNTPEPKKIAHLFSLENIDEVKIADSIIEELKNVFYSFIKSEPEYIKLFEHSNSIIQIAKKFGPFIRGIFKLPIDQAYIKRCFNVGYTHYKIELEPYAFTLGLWKITESIKRLNAWPLYSDNIIHLVNFLVNSALDACRQYEANVASQQYKILSRSILHDLSGPLNALEFRYENLLREFHQFGSTLDFSIKILQDAKNMVVVLDQKGKVSDAKSDILELHKLVDQIIELNLVKINEKKIQIKFESEQPSQVEIKSNRYKLTQVINNLLSNAINFTDLNGEIQIKLELSESDLILCISDTGVGIPPEDLNNIFNLESSISTLGTQGEKGSGYGLSIAKNFLDSLSYKVSVESMVKKDGAKNNHGTKFSILFPGEDIVSVANRIEEN